jgi:putative intracellular protease/amidase
MPKTNEILTIVTNVDEYEKFGFRTGLWLGELTHFWDVAEEAGFQLDIASPSGSYVPIDPESLAHAVLTMGGTDKRSQD